jgi:hypothetical protein
MTDLDVLLAVAGLAVTVLVVAGMILITPRGMVEVSDDVTDPQGAELSRAELIPGLASEAAQDPAPEGWAEADRWDPATVACQKALQPRFGQ